MSLYEGWPRSNGATYEERKILSFFTKTRLIKSIKIKHKGKERKLTRHMLDKFLKGDSVPTVFREKIMQYVREKSEEQAERVRKSSQE